MQTDLENLVDVLLSHLEELKDQGVRFLPMTPQTVAALDSAARKGELITSAPQARIQSPTASTPAHEVVVADQETPSSAVSARLDSSVTNVSTPAASAKLAAMAELRERALSCQKCPHLVRSRKNVVFGVGDIHSPLMFVGEAPGADEDVQGEPFVGAAGQLLTRIIRAMGFSRETVYIANILKCRPDTPGQTYGNRKPTSEEMRTCSPYLLAQIDLIQPKVIVALGATAVEGLLGLTEGISRLRGRFQTFRGVAVMPTFHPSYLLRKESIGAKRQVWEDMLQVLEKLSAPITEKQRNYFLKAS